MGIDGRYLLLLYIIKEEMPFLIKSAYKMTLTTLKVIL